MNADVARQVSALRETVARLHAELTRYGLVAWTAGNVSARVPGRDLMVIKPSGVDYDALSPDTMVVCDLDGTVIDTACRNIPESRKRRCGRICGYSIVRKPSE